MILSNSALILSWDTISAKFHCDGFCKPWFSAFNFPLAWLLFIFLCIASRNQYLNISYFAWTLLLLCQRRYVLCCLTREHGGECRKWTFSLKGWMELCLCRNEYSELKSRLAPFRHIQFHKRIDLLKQYKQLIDSQKGTKLPTPYYDHTTDKRSCSPAVRSRDPWATFTRQHASYLSDAIHVLLFQHDLVSSRLSTRNQRHAHSYLGAGSNCMM